MPDEIIYIYNYPEKHLTGIAAGYPVPGTDRDGDELKTQIPAIKCSSECIFYSP